MISNPQISIQPVQRNLCTPKCIHMKCALKVEPSQK
jgi:hypothetical protein